MLRFGVVLLIALIVATFVVERGASAILWGADDCAGCPCDQEEKPKEDTQQQPKAPCPPFCSACSCLAVALLQLPGPSQIKLPPSEAIGDNFTLMLLASQEEPQLPFKPPRL